jgi:very-short-patch-repair endonuclease
MKGERTGSWRVTHQMGEKRAKADLVIARIAARQHGVVSGGQLQSARLGRQAIYRRLQAGRLHRLHRGVYAVGHTNLSFEGRCLAAALAVGGEAAVSHRSAAVVWGILRAHDGRIDVTVPGNGGRRKRHGITVHRSHSLIAAVTTRRNGIAVTKPARTLRDLHRTSPQPVFQAAVRRALDLRLISNDELRADADLTRSELERRFLSLCSRHRLSPPEVNARVDQYEVDFLWREQKVIVEADSWRHHGHRAAFESDRGRDARLQSLGFRVLRFTWRQVLDTPETVARPLQALLGQMAYSFPFSHPLPP